MTELDERIQEFKERNEIQAVVAFCGGADEEKERVQRIITDSMVYFTGKGSNPRVAVVTGGTKWGIPKYATETAQDLGIPTIGVMPERGTKYQLADLGLQLVIPARYGESEFGDETEVLAKLANGVEIIGGGAGTGVEYFHMLKINERRCADKYKKEQQEKPDLPNPIIIAPLSGLGGLSEIIDSLPIKPEARCTLPDQRIYEGGDAARFILHKMGLY